MSDLFHIPYLEVNILTSCNLSCTGCAHCASFLAKEYLSLDDLKRTYEEWLPKIEVGHLCLMGGEPLLHPDIFEIVKITNNFYEGTKSIATNGLLLNNMPLVFFKLLEETNWHLRISVHHRSFGNILQNLLSVFGGEFNVDSCYHFSVPYTSADNKTITLRNGDAKQAYDDCALKRSCVTLFDNKLWHCSLLPRFHKMIEQNKVLNYDQSSLLKYKAATSDYSMQQLTDWWNYDFHSACEVCGGDAEIRNKTVRAIELTN
jgi:organic radical activating enzyme